MSNKLIAYVAGLKTVLVPRPRPLGCITRMSFTHISTQLMNTYGPITRWVVMLISRSSATASRIDLKCFHFVGIILTPSDDSTSFRFKVLALTKHLAF